MQLHTGVTDTIREPALKVDSGRKIPYHTGELNLHQRHARPTLHQLSYIPVARRVGCMGFISFLYQYILLPHVLPIHCHMLSYALSPFTCLLVTHCQERVAYWILITCEILPQIDGTPNAVYLYVQTCIFKNKTKTKKTPLVKLWSV